MGINARERNRIESEETHVDGYEGERAHSFEKAIGRLRISGLGWCWLCTGGLGARENEEHRGWDE